MLIIFRGKRALFYSLSLSIVAFYLSHEPLSVVLPRVVGGTPSLSLQTAILQTPRYEYSASCEPSPPRPSPAFSPPKFIGLELIICRAEVQRT